MKLLLDQGLPRSAAIKLANAGIDVIHVGDIGLASADDALILHQARIDGRIVVTLDADFHALLALSGSAEPSIIRIRIEGLRGREAADLISKVISICREDLSHGALVTVQGNRVRVRRLPL